MTSIIEFSDPSDNEIQPELVQVKASKKELDTIPDKWLQWKEKSDYIAFQSFTEYVMGFMLWMNTGKWEFFSPDRYLEMFRNQ